MIEDKGTVEDSSTQELKTKILGVKYLKDDFLDYIDTIEGETSMEGGLLRVTHTDLYKLEHRSIGCIALVEIEGDLIIGYSLCDEEDSFSKFEGKRIALERAKKRYLNGCEAKLSSEELKVFPKHLRKTAVACEFNLLKDFEIDSIF